MPLMLFNKKSMIPIYETLNGTTLISPEQSVPIPINNFKLDLSKLLLTKSKTGAEVTDAFTGDDDPKSTQTLEMGTTEKHPAKKEATAKAKFDNL
jgi:hypothetical protein